MTLLKRFPMIAAVLSLLPGSLQSQIVYNAQGVRYHADPVISELRQPVALVFLPDGRALLVQRQNPVLHLADLPTGRLTALDQPVPALTGEDSGLHDLVLHPDYARNGWLYLSYSSGTPERSTLVIDRFRLRGAAVTDRERIFTAEAYSEDRFHYGGRMVWKEGFLYVTVGDRHHQDWAQDLSLHAGKVLRLTEDGKAAPGNPFAGRDKARPEIWCYGVRNAQGMAVQPGSGEIWLNEHGPLGGDELNRVQPGANYGWPVVSWGWQYSGGPIGMGITRQEGITNPAWVWTPALAPSGLVIYRGSKFPAWTGSFLSGAMALQHLNRLAMEEGRVVVEERLLNRKLGRVRLVAEGPDGLLYIGTDSREGEAGKLYRIRPAG